MSFLKHGQNKYFHLFTKKGISHFTNLRWAEEFVFYEFWFKRHNSERLEAQIFPTKFMLQQIKEENLAHSETI